MCLTHKETSSEKRQATPAWVTKMHIIFHSVCLRNSILLTDNPAREMLCASGVVDDLEDIPLDAQTRALKPPSNTGMLHVYIV